MGDLASVNKVKELRKMNLDINLWTPHVCAHTCIGVHMLEHLYPHMHTTYMHEKLELKYNRGKYKKYSLKFLQFFTHRYEYLLPTSY